MIDIVKLSLFFPFTDEKTEHWSIRDFPKIPQTLNSRRVPLNSDFPVLLYSVQFAGHHVASKLPP